MEPKQLDQKILIFGVEYEYSTEPYYLDKDKKRQKCGELELNNELNYIRPVVK